MKNWIGRKVQKEINKEDTVVQFGCGIMNDMADACKGDVKEDLLHCKRLLGVDIYQPYLDYLNKYGIETMQLDLSKTPLPFESNSFDHVVMIGFIEHLPSIYHVEQILAESIRIAKKKVILTTPMYWNQNEIDSWDMGTNLHMLHHTVIPKELLKKYGFKIKQLHGRNHDGHYFGVRKT